MLAIIEQYLIKTSHLLQGVDENEFIEACRLVYDGVREVRRAVLVNREGEDTDTEEEQEEEVTRPLEVAEVSLVDEYPDISGKKTIPD